MRRLLATIERGMRYVGFALMGLGIGAAVAPVLSGLAIAVVVGVVLSAAGVLMGLFGLRARESGKGNVALVIGGVTGLCGLTLVVQPSAGLAVVRWVLVAYLLVSGLWEMALAMRLRPEEGAVAALGTAGVSILAGLALSLDWPISGARAVGVLIGIKLMSSGWWVMRLQRTLGRVTDKLHSARHGLARPVADHRPL